jgi:hypothetical protein
VEKNTNASAPEVTLRNNLCFLVAAASGNIRIWAFGRTSGGLRLRLRPRLGGGAVRGRRRRTAAG